MTNQKSLKKNAFYNLIKNFLSLVFPTITFPYASRILGPEGIGRVNFANSIVSYFVMFAWLGIQGYAAREASKIRDDKIALSKFVKEILAINSVSTITSYAIFIFVIVFIPKLSEYRPLLLICSIRILFTSIGIDWLYTALEEFKYTTIRSFVFQFISLAFLILFVHNKEHTVFYAIFGIISSVGSNICNLFHSHKYIDYKLKTEIKPTTHLKSILVFTGMSFTISIYTLLDSAMLGFLSTDMQVGFYSAANKLNHMVLSMLSALVSVLLPRLTIYVANNQEKKFSILAQKSVSLMFLLSIPMATGLFLLAKPLTVLFSGEDYLPAILPMRIITPIVIAIPLANITAAQMLPALNKEKLMFFSYIFAAMLNAIINLIFIPRFGALGAAFGTVVAEVGGVFIQIAFLKKFLIAKTTFINLYQALLSSAIMFFTLTFYLHLVSNFLGQVLGALVLGVITYSVCLIILKNRLFIETKKTIQNYFIDRRK